MNQPPQDRKRLPPRPLLVQAMSELRALGSDNPEMLESGFREFVKELYDPVTDKFNVQLWYQTFGYTRKGVNIIDAGRQVLFVCPPLLGFNATSIAERRGQSLAALNDLAQQNERRHAALGAKTMQEGLTDYGNNQLKVMTTREAWIKVLARYGRLPDNMQAEAVGQGTTLPAGMSLLTGPEEEL